jgi:translin
MMKNLEDIIKKIDKNINKKEKIRDKSLKNTREIITGCRKAIQALHKNSMQDAKNYIKNASNKLSELYDITTEHPDIFYSGFVENAAQEFVEAYCFFNIKSGKELPDPDELKTTYSAYLMGLCDFVGELRRGALNFILIGETTKANEYLQYMDEIYDSIMSLDYPSGLIPIKRKQDVLRSLIDKTRSELAITGFEQRIDNKIHEFCDLIEKINDIKKTKNHKKELMDIDIDKVW